MEYRIRETHSTSYVNDKEYINNALKTLDSHVWSVKNHINNKNEDIVNKMSQCKTLSSVGESHTTEKYSEHVTFR